MGATDGYISGLSDIKPEIVDFVTPKLRSTSEFIGTQYGAFSQLDEKILKGINQGDYLMTFAYEAKEEVKDQTRIYIEEQHPGAMSKFDVNTEQINEYIDDAVGNEDNISNGNGSSIWR